MRLEEIPAGHLAVNSHGDIVLVGKDHSMWLYGGNTFESMDTKTFCDEYEDLGELKINIGVKTIKKISFEAKL